MASKPHKGSLTNWRKHFPKHYNTEGTLGYVILGSFVDHPDFAGMEGNTSLVVFHDEETGYIETLNSSYNLIGPEEQR